MTSSNYQITWFGQTSSKVVKTLEEAKQLYDEILEDYRKSYEAGWVTYFDPSAVQINSTTKKCGSY